METKTRCGWCLSSDLYKEYHDVNGEPLFMMMPLYLRLILETFQAGLSITIPTKGRISGKHLTISTIKNSPLFGRQDPSPYWTQESFATN
jgi:hypothetical protein